VKKNQTIWIKTVCLPATLFKSVFQNLRRLSWADFHTWLNFQTKSAACLFYYCVYIRLLKHEKPEPIFRNPNCSEL